ncbi:hypothetical protein LX16_2169 [Stackebrandtia albiflava]|uniref:Uncharacterized protein n=1 Tax=Stackebrandtia albiflava TaxID=406432 RepID=A0A562V0N6_9ACTN|nr:hypothetical protein [Stackebrandtia albiflava]TWJ11448.1 hypothetical protein LX16_2169 [Stackebrandtia albiflava]
MTDDIKAVFEQTLPETEPPPRWDTGRYLEAGRTRRRRRHIAAAGTGTFAVVAAALAVAIPLSVPGADVATPGDDTPEPSASTTLPTQYPPAPADWDEYTEIVSGLIAEQFPELLVQDLSEVFELAETGEAWTDDPDAAMEIPHTAELWFETAEGEPAGSLSVRLFEPGPWTDEISEEWLHYPDPFGGPLVGCWSGSYEVQQEDSGVVKTMHTETTCDEATTSDGDRMVTVESRQFYEGEPVQSIRKTVVVYRADDTAVMLATHCGNDDEDEESGRCYESPVDVAALAAIAQDLPAIIVTDDGR